MLAACDCVAAPPTHVTWRPYAPAPRADAELPGKASLADRRAKYDALKARQAAQLAALEDASAAQRPPPELDEAYLAAQARSEVRSRCSCVFSFFCVRLRDFGVGFAPD